MLATKASLEDGASAVLEFLVKSRARASLTLVRSEHGPRVASRQDHFAKGAKSQK